MSQASVITKSPKSQASSRVIALTTITNPYDVNSANYITNIDSAIALAKDGQSLENVKVLDLANEPVPSWKGDYKTDIRNNEVLTNLGITAHSSVKVIVIEDPNKAFDDVGASLITGGSDQTHKVHVTHLENILSQIDEGITVSTRAIAPWATAILQVLYPASGRHMCIDKFGIIHVVYQKEVDNFTRVIHCWSDTGGEYWQSEYADLGIPGYHYISPTITTDNQGGMHLLFAVDTAYNPCTYLYYAGGATPAGWTLVSDVGGPCYNRFVISADGAGQVLSDQPNPAHVLTYIDQTPELYVPMYGGHSCWTGGGPNGTVSGCGTHYMNSRTIDWNYGGSSKVPPYRTAKLIRYPGIPPVIPKDCLLLFSSTLPAGYTRAAEYDGVFIRCSNTVGATGGALTHRHRIYGSTGTAGGMPYNGGIEEDYPITVVHGHSFDGIVTHDNDPAAYNFVIGRVDNDTSVIPQNALFMFDMLPESYYWEPLSEVGGPLYSRMQKGGAAYGDAGGYAKHGTDPWNIPCNTVSHDGGGASSGGGCVSDYSHNHYLRVRLSLEYSFPASNLFHLCRCKSSYTTTPLDIYYSYKPPGGSWTTPVNIVNSGTDMLKLGLSALCDSDDNVRVVFSDFSSTTIDPATFARTNLSKIKYVEKVGTWQPIENVSDVPDKYYYYPSIDIDKSNNTHTAWSNSTDNNEILYRMKNRATGLWQPIEQAVSLANIGNTSDIVVTSNDDVYLMFFEHLGDPSGVRDMRLASKKGGVWQPSVKLSDLTASGYNQYYGQMCRDKDDNLLLSWGGQGYGANPDYYRLVYRYLNKDGTFNPTLDLPAAEIFENEAKDDVFPVVFWNPLPDTENVYTNIMSEGFAFCYLKDVRGTPEVVDLMFNSSPFAVVGAGKGVLQKNTDFVYTRGSICRTRISPARSYSKKIR